MATHHDIAGRAQSNLHHLSLSIAQGETEGLDGLAACVIPFLSALDWRGDARQVAEALPHAVEEIDLVDFRNVMARLGLSVHTAEMRLGVACSRFAPCVFLPRSGAPLVVMSANGDDAWAFDSADGTYRDLPLGGPKGAQAGGRHGLAIFVARRDAVDRPEPPGASRQWLGEVTFRFRKLIYAALAITFGMSLLGLIAPLGIMAIYVAVLPRDAATTIPYLTAAVLACLLAEAGLRQARASIQAHIAGRVDYLVATEAFERVLRIPAALTTTATVGDQAARLRSFQSIREVFVSPMTAVVLEAPFLPIYIAVIAAVAGWVAVVPVAALLVYVAFGALLMRGVKRKTDAAGQLRSDRHAFLVEMLRQMPAIKQLGAEKIWQDRFRALSGRTAFASFEASRANFAVQDLSHVVMVSSGIATMALAVYLILTGDLHSGVLITVMALTWRVLSPIQGGLRFISQLEKVWTTARQLNALMRIPTESQGEGCNLERRIVFGGIECHNVSLRFGRKAEPALLGVNFKIKWGEFVVVAGSSGSGKSTLMKALLRLHDPQTGSILIDGVDIRQVAPPELRRSIGYAPQYPKMMYGTIAQNMRLYEPSATTEELEDVCRELGILEMVQSLPEGFDTRFGDQTVNRLPPGFLNCFSVAAALLRRPAILLLDEAHDGLDGEMEAKFLACVKRLRGKTTIVMSTHRPSHMRMADRILLLDEGRLVENAPPAEAMERVQARLFGASAAAPPRQPK